MKLETFNVVLKTGSFMFIDNLSLSRGLPFEVKVDDVSDAVLQALTVAVHRSAVAATVGFGDILNAIRSADVRSGTLELLGLSVAKVEETAVVEVVDEVQEVQEVTLRSNSEGVLTPEVIEEGAKQEVGETETDKDVLDAIIRGQTVHVVKHLKANQLSKEDKAYLLEKERAGKARYQVIALLNDE